MDGRAELFSNMRLTLRAYLHFQLQMCAAAPYGCVSRARTVHSVLQSLSIDFISRHTPHMNVDCW